MALFFRPNISRAGRWLRGVLGLACIAGGIIAWSASPWAGGLLVGFGVFGAAEAVRGWCLLRACGIKTRF
jgi:uncharacterized membrane protein